MTDFYYFCRYYFHEISVFFFFLGACIGSFLNVCVWRIPRGESIISPGSYCPLCKNRIRTFDNIPIVSWLLLRGKCGHCHARISPRYVIIEFFTAALFLFIWYRIFAKSWPLSLLIPFAFVAASSILIALVDYTHLIIPNIIILCGLVFAISWGLVFPATHQYGLVSKIYSGMVEDLVITFAATGGSVNVSYLLDTPLLFAIVDLMVGMIVGGGFLFLFGKLGRLIWGVKKTVKKLPAEFTICGKGLRMDGGELIHWKTLFKSSSDVLKIDGILKKIAPSGEKKIPSSFTEIAGKEKKFILTRDKIFVDSLSAELAGCDVVIETKQWVMHQEVMGMGDVKFMTMLGAILGPIGALFIIFLSSLSGSLLGGLYGLTSTLLFSREREDRIPFGPFIAFAAIVYIFFGEELILYLFPVTIF